MTLVFDVRVVQKNKVEGPKIKVPKFGSFWDLRWMVSRCQKISTKKNDNSWQGVLAPPACKRTKCVSGDPGERSPLENIHDFIMILNKNLKEICQSRV